MGIAKTGKKKRETNHEFEQQKKEHQDYMEEQRVKRGPWWKRLTTFTTPVLVPPVQSVDLFFFHRAFKRFRGETAQESITQMLDGDAEVPLVDFQRAMVRFFKAIRTCEDFDVQKYDTNGNGHISWFEFCKFWHDRDASVHFTFCERLFLTLEDPDRSMLGKMMSFLVFFTILLSTGSFIVSTMPEFQIECPALGEGGYDADCLPAPLPIFETIEVACVMFFTIEYGVRLFLSGFMRTELADRDRTQLLNWMCAEEVISLPTFCQRVLSFALSFSNVIDLLAILPWYLTALFANTRFRDNALLKIIRLTRVFRAFRLGRRFEAVVIIARSLKISQRALFVLVLNLLLGMIIFGALMYFAEQGTWSPEKQAYIRVVGESWNETIFKWQVDEDRSPFESIPACFWWAIVTATTVGYGDIHTPTTVPGKVVAVIAMVWSLCVLALPIGVIGSNFSDVWEEYDREKTEEEISHRQQEVMVRQSRAWGDPLDLAKMLVVEVWHNAGLSSSATEQVDTTQCEFLGEVEFKLNIDPWEPRHHEVVKAPLTPNWKKAKRRVSGTLTFEYSWTPRVEKDLKDIDGHILARGTLEVCRFRATDLLNIDYKEAGLADPFCVVRANTGKPKGDVDVVQTCCATDVVWDTCDPVWSGSMSFDFLWYKVVDAVIEDLRRTMSQNQKKRHTSPCLVRRSDRPAATQGDATEVPADVIQRVVPELQRSLGQLSSSVPKLQADLQDVRQDMQLILETIRRRRSSIVRGNDTFGPSLRDERSDDWSLDVVRPRSGTLR
eukprot:TRINITY_DN31246_c0_g1_i1.p1 TRINITY_DN31246_c0_g1~~TRINITY_DN31246_c0_g1_i1.p1  ORF type:complete len:780 (+),score=122.29 TRINITY_DN31246_c0_g1_i1:88-2427(+)